MNVPNISAIVSSKFISLCRKIVSKKSGELIAVFISATRTNYIYSEVYNKFFITSRDIIEYNKEFIKYTTQLYNIDTNNWENEQGYNVYKLDVYGRVIEGGWYDEKGEYHIDVQYSYTNNGYIEYSKFNGISVLLSDIDIVLNS